MDFFLRHSLQLDEDRLCGAGGAVSEARELLHALCEDVHRPTEGAMVLCHRDYHARNLMILDDGDATLAVIDFQDTRRGQGTRWIKAK